MTKKKIEILLPEGALPVGLSEEQSAKSWGVSPGTFREIQIKYPGIAPRARRLRNQKRYSRIEVEDAFHKLPYWDETEPGSEPDDDWSIN